MASANLDTVSSNWYRGYSLVFYFTFGHFFKIGVLGPVFFYVRKIFKLSGPGIFIFKKQFCKVIIGSLRLVG